MLAVLLGLACGDAVGTTVEFSPRGTFDPVTDMVGGGPFGLQAGQWTDDTSMALCLAHSLLERKGFDAADQMQKYVAWFNDGYMSSTGVCFDIGNTVHDALTRFGASGNAFSGSTDRFSAGNGSIMRLAPVPMFYADNRDEMLHFCAESSRTTHGAAECVDACQLLGVILWKGLLGGSKEAMLVEHGFRPKTPAITAIANGTYRHKSIDDIQGSGYVVKSLEAALWCFDQTNSFEAAILTATNLGDDADTTAAIAGQIAGAFYGENGIPKTWRTKLTQHAMIKAVAMQLMPEILRS